MGKIKPLTVLLVCVLVITAAICIVGGIAAGAEGDKTDAEKMREMADRVEDAILSVDDSYKKQVEVVTYPLTYSDDRTIIVIAENGLDKTTTKAIVKGTEINEAYIYRYFSDKIVNFL